MNNRNCNNNVFLSNETAHIHHDSRIDQYNRTPVLYNQCTCPRPLLHFPTETRSQVTTNIPLLRAQPLQNWPVPEQQQQQYAAVHQIYKSPNVAIIAREHIPYRPILPYRHTQPPIINDMRNVHPLNQIYIPPTSRLETPLSTQRQLVVKPFIDLQCNKGATMQDTQLVFPSCESIPSFPPICDPVSPCSDDLPPSPKKLCIDIQNEPIVIEDEDIEDEDCNNKNEDSPIDSGSLISDKPLEKPLPILLDIPEDIFNISNDTDMENQLPFANFLTSPKNYSRCCSPLSADSKLTCEETDYTSFNVSIPLAIATPIIKCRKPTSLTVSIPIHFWNENSRKNSSTKNKHSNTNRLPGDSEDDKALTELEKIFEQSNLLTPKDEKFIRKFLKGETVETDNYVRRYALLRMFDGDNLQYASIELDTLNKQWRGVMIDATDTTVTSFNNELL